MRHAQTELESSLKLTLVKVIPMIEEIKGKLVFLSPGIVNSSSLQSPSEFTQLLAKHTVEVLNDVKYYGVWCNA